MTTIRKHFRGAMIALSIMAGPVAGAAGQDATFVDGFSPTWIVSQGVTMQASGGPEADGGFGRLGENACLEAPLGARDGSPGGLSDFFIEFYFRQPKAAGQEFNLKLATVQNAPTALASPVLSLFFDASKGWGVGSATGGPAVWQALPASQSAPGGWFHVVFTGRDWGQSGARYSLQMFGPVAADAGATPANAADFQMTNAAPASGGGTYFAFGTTGGDGANTDVAEVRAGSIGAYHGPIAKGVDTQTLSAKVMCGYQGWFGAPNDGSGLHGWRHWTKHSGPLEDGNAKVDLWPDVTELSPEERFATGFKLPDGRPAEVFSSYVQPTVLRHFQWMRDYGIDGAFVQRFATGLRSPVELGRGDTVLANCRAGANQNGRAYAVMYDLSGLRAGEIGRVINDWRHLRRDMAITEDPAYLHHHGKPVVSVWGVGFSDHRDYTLEDCRRLIEFLKNDPESGGCTVILGVPAHWRDLDMDAMTDPKLLDVLQLADVISPWTVGRYTTPEGAARYAQDILKPDQAWCQQRNLEYLPVVFPGFSWHNMYGGPSNKIPRLHGKFLWSQFLEAKRAGASMIYVAMFDEVDEGTAIFKCANNVPVSGESTFINFEGLPSDFYLKMVGSGGKLLRGEIPLDAMLDAPAIPGQN